MYLNCTVRQYRREPERMLVVENVQLFVELLTSIVNLWNQHCTKNNIKYFQYPQKNNINKLKITYSKNFWMFSVDFTTLWAQSKCS